jgi:hypothetical protein
MYNEILSMFVQKLLRGKATSMTYSLCVLVALRICT